jgi:CheY-like chemotaxis protein
MTLDHSKWMIAPGGEWRWEDRRLSSNVFHVVHVDDHKLFTTGVKKFCIDAFFGEIELMVFRNGSEAFRYIRECMDENIPVDLLITDINHPGMNGSMLVMNLRAYEEKIKKKIPLPILVLTMMGNDFIEKEKEFPYFRINKHLTKAASSDEIIDAMEELLFLKKKWLTECYIAGFQYYEGAGLLPLMRRGTRLLLQREKDNSHDPRAVAVYLKDRKLGYLPAGKNFAVSKILDDGMPSLFAEITEVNAEGPNWGKLKVGVGIS